MQSSQQDISELVFNLNGDLHATPENGIFTGGQGVVVRNMDDGLTKDENFNVVPGTFWHDDIWPPNQIYPWGDRYGNGTDIIAGTGNGAWVTPTLAVAIGPEHFNAIFNTLDLHDANWTDGVWYAHDSNSCDKRALYCEGTDEKGDYKGYDCPGAWVDLKNYSSGNPFILTKDLDKLGSGYYLAGNPYKPDKDNPEGKNFGGGGTGMHCMYTYQNVLDGNTQVEFQINGSKEDPPLPNGLFKDYSCQIDYSAWNTSTTGIMEDSVEGWHPWITRFSDAAIKQLGEPVPAWAADLAIGWVNNPRPMITLQNALWKYREEWCDNDSVGPKDPNSFEHYWGWNEIPFTRTQITNKDNWTCFIIVLPPCEDTEITLSKWLLNNKDNSFCVSNLVKQFDKYYIDYGLEPNSSRVLVVKQIPVDIEVLPHKVWRRCFFTEQVEIGGGWKIGENGVIQKF